MDPRDFLILKYYDRRDENTCVEISKSIIIDGLKPRSLFILFIGLKHKKTPQELLYC